MSNKKNRYQEFQKRPDVVAQYEAEQKRKEEENKKKSWEEGGEFTRGDNPFGLSEKSSFEILFPQYREEYFKKNMKDIENILKNKTLELKVDYKKGTATVSTTDDTYDPFIIIKGRDMVQLLARGIDLDQAKRVLDDNVFCEIIKLQSLMTSKKKETFIRRRQRLLGPDGATLKAIELLTGCHIVVQGKTVSVIGDVKGIKQVSKIVADCMQNVHPIYNIKQLMVMKELEKNPSMKNVSWDPYLPKFKKSNAKRPKKKKKEKKPYNPFPNPPEKSKVDLELESGVYFLPEKVKERVKMKEKKKQMKAAVKAKQEERQKEFIPPSETKKTSKSDKQAKTDITQKILENTKKHNKRKRDTVNGIESFIERPAKKKK